jgi:hypothetical protein
MSFNNRRFRMCFVWLIVRLSDGMVEVARGKHDLSSWLCNVQFPSAALLVRFQTRLSPEREWLPSNWSPYTGIKLPDYPT